MATNTQKTGVRKFLTDSGYKDTDIGYDGNRGMVTLQGKDFYSATPEADSSTYGNYGDLSSSLNAYRTQQQKAQLDPLVATLTNRATAAPAAAYTPQAYGGFNPNTSQAFQAAKQNVLQDANTATNNAMVNMGARGIGNSSAAVDRGNQIQQSAVSRINNELLPQYEQQDYNRWRDTVSDQRYTNETDYVRSLDQQKSLQDVAKYLSDSIQQNYNNDVTNAGFTGYWNGERTLAGQIQDTNKMATMADLSGYYNPYVDQIGQMNANSAAWWNANPEERQRLAAANQQTGQQIGATQDAQGNWIMPQGQLTYGARRDQRNDQYQAARDERNDFVADRNYQLDQEQLGISRMNAANSAESTNISRAMDIWRMTGVAPPGIPGVDPGTPLASANSSQIAKMTEEKQGLVEALRAGSIAPAAAYQQIQDDLSYGFYTPQEAAELQGIIQSYTQRSQPTNVPELTKDQQNAMPSANQLNKLYTEQGKPVGAPEIDWKAWYKDPLGRVAGVDFSTWQRLYGPQLKAK